MHAYCIDIKMSVTVTLKRDRGAIFISLQCLLATRCERISKIQDFT